MIIRIFIPITVGALCFIATATHTVTVTWTIGRDLVETPDAAPVYSSSYHFLSSFVAIIITFVLLSARKFVSRVPWLLQDTARRSISWASLIMPAKHRDEIEGDFIESIETAKARGFGPFAIFMLRIAKCLLYLWVGLKLRVTDIVSLESGERETR